MVALPRIIVKRWPGAGVDVLVNNAGLGRNNAALWDGSTASWVEMISTNVLGVCMCTREAIQVGFTTPKPPVGQPHTAAEVSCVLSVLPRAPDGIAPSRSLTATSESSALMPVSPLTVIKLIC